MKNNLRKLFGKLRQFDTTHADEGFQITPEGEKIRIERRQGARRRLHARRAASRELSVDRRVESLERRLGVDWRAWVK